MSETENRKPRVAGGIFVALGLLVGAVVGIAINQPSAGMIAGFGVGAVIALVIWLIDSKRG
jgi:uncharacterized membrane protein